MNNGLKQARYFILTIPADAEKTMTTEFFEAAVEESLEGLIHVEGQQEIGEGGYVHWQVVASFGKAVGLKAVKKVFGRTCHIEATRSDAARAYVHKQDTQVEGTRFEFGSLAHRRNSKTDWNNVRTLAQSGLLNEIPAEIYCRHYGNLRSIAKDNLKAVGIEKNVSVYWGPSGTGKSHMAWDQAGPDAFPKDPNSKFWDGYNGQENVVIDEFRGMISISHMLRWLDKYPVTVEIKGSAVVLRAKRIWVTSNLSPELWYPGLDPITFSALRRRINVTHFNDFFSMPDVSTTPATFRYVEHDFEQMPQRFRSGAGAEQRSPSPSGSQTTLTEESSQDDEASDPEGKRLEFGGEM